MSCFVGEGGAEPLHVSLVAIPEAVVSTISGIFDVINVFTIMDGAPDLRLRGAPFRVEIVGERPGLLQLASGIPLAVHRAVAEVEATDIIIVPSILLAPGGWQSGRHPELLDWCAAMHSRGALLCSACSGIFLLAETGLFDGEDATVHFGYADAFASHFPEVRIHPDQVLVVAGRREELISSGASMTWHDLVLYLIARHVGVTAAQSVARLFALQWHQDGLTPYIVFEGRRDHGDFAVRVAQDWIATHFPVGNPVEQMARRSGLGERTFKRRFAAAVGMPPLPISSVCGSRMRSGAWSVRKWRSTRSAGRSATKIQPSFAGSSSGWTAFLPALTGGGSAFPTTQHPARREAGIPPAAEKGGHEEGGCSNRGFRAATRDTCWIDCVRASRGVGADRIKFTK